jgi:ATP-dependent HslUV protease subunit HslV
LRRLEAVLAVADREHSLLVAGSGEVIEPDDGILALGSGGAFALAAARALMVHSDLPAAEMVRESLEIAGQICVYSNTEITVLELEGS